MEFTNDDKDNSYQHLKKVTYDARNIKASSVREKKTLAIGDSFIGIFKLLKNEANVRVEKIKGGTAKGIFRTGSESNTKLKEIMQGKHHYDYGIFNFGQVDHHISFYWDLIEKKQENDIEYYNTLAHDYVNFIAALPGFDKKIIFGVYPLPCETDYVSKYLCCYTRIGDEKVEAYVNDNKQRWDELTSLECRARRIINFNAALEKECLAHEIEFASLYDKLVDENHNVLSTFKDPSACNIHLLWEPLVAEWCKYFENQDTGISEKYLEDIEKTAQAYLHEKTREVNKWKGIKNEDEPEYDQVLSSSNKYVDTYVAKDRRNYNRNNSTTPNTTGSPYSRTSYNNNRDDRNSNGSNYSNGYNKQNGNNGNNRMSQRFEGNTNHNSHSNKNNNNNSDSNSNSNNATTTSAATTTPPTNLYVPPHLRNKK